MKQSFIKLAKTASKIVVPGFEPDERFYIFQMEYQGKQVYVLCSIRKGTHWNISGSRWFYLHDSNSGNFIASFDSGIALPKNKERLLKKDLELLNATRKQVA